MLTITNYKEVIDPVILKRGQNYFKSGKVGAIRKNGRGTFYAKVKGTENYDVELTITKNGKISSAYCNCPYEYGEYCKHIAAMLMALENQIAPTVHATESSAEVFSLIDEYKLSENIVKTEIIPPEMLRLRTLLYYDIYEHKLEASLKIGCEKMYKIRDIGQLYFNFQSEAYVEYGKFLAFTHRADRLDGQSRQLLKIIGLAYASSFDFYGRKDRVEITGMHLDDLFELYRDEYVLIDDKPFLVEFKNPSLTFEIKRDLKNRFSLKTNCRLDTAGAGRRSYFLDRNKQKLYAADPEFTRAVYRLYETVCYKRSICISETDMSEFYASVLKRASEYAKTDGLELVSEYTPPELTVQLYVDCGENNAIYADLMFCYGNNTYNCFSGKTTPHYDEPGENAAKTAVLRYFSVCPGRDHRTLLAADDSAAYEFITNGVPEFSKTMELYVTDRLRRMTVRPAVKPKIGVRMSAGLLELDISDDSYTDEELVEILTAYRAKVKYRRLKDGSFVLIDNAEASLAQLGELIENLDIKDKDLLRKKIKLPTYRMLYLDSLQNRNGSQMLCDDEFKKTVSEYRKSIDDPKSLTVPGELSGVMRDYQKYGFRWLKTIAAYRFGGILADDMGLGKTIQAISLILDNKQQNKKALPALIICPSSLTLNWEAEIQRFAPRLKALTVIGTAAARAALIEKIPKGKYDAVITSYAMLTRDIDRYADLRFSLHFIDEAQYIKNHNTQAAKAVKAVNSRVRFALTGTPVENSLAELWSAFDFIMPGYLFNYTRFKNTYEAPIAVKKDEKAIKALQSTVSPFILRRLKKDVLNELPDKTETVLSAVMEGEQRKLYAANVSALKKSVKSGLGSDKTDRVKILAVLTRLREICCDPLLVYDDFKGKSAKLEQCAELIESCVDSGHKILLFSQFTSMLEIIAKRLDKMNISYYTLRGSTRAKDRIRMVNEFNANDVKVFLISLKAGGTGLNLTGADIVIHYDPWWNASAENQASDRAYRIGQRKNVQVYKLITRNSIEEKILELQQSKSELGSLICGESADITKMSAAEILKLLE